MKYIISNINNNIIFSSFLVFSLISALFYTGKDVWLFTSSYLFISFNIAVVLQQRFYRSLPIAINGIFITSILLIIWFAISIFPSQIKYLSLYNFFWLGSFLITFFIFTFNENKDQAWNTVWPIILLLVFLWSIYGLVQYYYMRVPSNASFLNKNSLAALVNLSLIPASGYFLLKQNTRPWYFLNNKIFSFILFTLFLTTFIIASRGGSLSLVIGFLILYFILRKDINTKQLYLLLMIIVASFLCAALSQYFIADLPTGFSERMASIKDTAKAGNMRFIIWNSLLPLFSDMPWYGLGLGSLWLFWPPYRSLADTSAGFFAHNDYMQITLEAGYPGIILLFILFIFILISFIRILRNQTQNELSLIHKIELVSLFSALTTLSVHSVFTYNFYVLPLLLIAGLYLGRFNQLISIESNTNKIIPALKNYFRPSIYIFCMSIFIFIISGYFLTISFSSYYNNEAKRLMKKNKYQDASTLFLKAQTLAPLMDNPFFSHADLLRRGADRLFAANKVKQANSLIRLALLDLDKAEQLNPLRPQIHHIRALIYQRTQAEKAKAEFKYALTINPRFLYSRISLAKQLHDERNLKQAIEVLYQGVDYNYPVNKIMLQYMRMFAQYSREAGLENYALHLESNINKFIKQNYQKSTPFQ